MRTSDLTRPMATKTKPASKPAAKASPDLQPASLETAKKLGLREEEYQKIQEILGRVPNFTELSIYSAMWSEHCSYKNSIRLLKTLPRTGPKLLAEAGQEKVRKIALAEQRRRAAQQTLRCRGHVEAGGDRALTAAPPHTRFSGKAGSSAGLYHFY